MTSFSIDAILGVGNVSCFELERGGNRELPPKEFCVRTSVLRDEGEVVCDDGDCAKDLTKKIRAEIRNRVKRSVLRFQQMDRMLSEHETINFFSTDCDKRGKTVLRPYISVDIFKNSFSWT